MSNKVVISIVVIVVLVVLGFIFLGGDDSTNQNSQDSGTTLPSRTQPSESSNIWMNFQLTNVNDGETFTISELNTKPILLETFAVWCPTCTRQQREIKKLHDEIGDEVVSISLDTDASEDEAQVLEHTQANGFTWHYAIAPSELTQSLIDEFGVGIISAPSVPMILICEDGSFRQLGRGIKRVQELKDELATCQS